MTFSTKHARFGTPRVSAGEGGEARRSHSGHLLEVVRRETVTHSIAVDTQILPTGSQQAQAGASYQLGLVGGTVVNEHAQIDESGVLIDTLR
jgi:hypothetical protein